MKLEGDHVSISIHSGSKPAAEPARPLLPWWGKPAALFFFVMGIAAIAEYGPSIGLDGIGAVIGAAMCMIKIVMS